MKKLNEVTAEKKELESKLEFSVAKLSGFCAGKVRRKKKENVDSGEPHRVDFEAGSGFAVKKPADQVETALGTFPSFYPCSTLI